MEKDLANFSYLPKSVKVEPTPIKSSEPESLPEILVK